MKRAWKMLCHNYLMALAAACLSRRVPIHCLGRGNAQSLTLQSFIIEELRKCGIDLSALGE
jgi:hypothetical protein